MCEASRISKASCRVMTLDVTDAENVREVIAAAGPLDVIVNNAGYGLIGAVEECSDEQIRRNVETNFFGPLNVIRAALPGLRAQRCGHIVNISARRRSRTTRALASTVARRRRWS
jgi:NADP-dependent 3-hydroxy acid dehydrogenase YdfG